MGTEARSRTCFRGTRSSLPFIAEARHTGELVPTKTEAHYIKKNRSVDCHCARLPETCVASCPASACGKDIISRPSAAITCRALRFCPWWEGERHRRPAEDVTDGFLFNPRASDRVTTERLAGRRDQVFVSFSSVVSRHRPRRTNSSHIFIRPHSSFFLMVPALFKPHVSQQ